MIVSEDVCEDLCTSQGTTSSKTLHLLPTYSSWISFLDLISALLELDFSFLLEAASHERFWMADWKVYK